MGKLNREPLITVATVTGLASAIITLLVAFGVGLTADQTKALLGLVSVLAPLIVAFIARRKVTPLSDPRNAAGERLSANAEESH